jgi:hypothetical protein
LVRINKQTEATGKPAAQRGFLLGINKSQIANADLNGCVNDISEMRDMLIKNFGFRPDDLRVVNDKLSPPKCHLGVAEVAGKGGQDRLLRTQMKREN